MIKIFRPMPRCLRRFSIHLSSIFAVCAVSVVALPAQAFDYTAYQETDLDELLARKRPTSGVDLLATSLKLRGKLVAYGKPCETAALDAAMTMVKLFDQKVKISHCIEVRSAKNRQFQLFIQDQVSEFLPKEVPLGATLTLFVVHVFTSPVGPGLLVNEFQADEPAKPI